MAWADLKQMLMREPTREERDEFEAAFLDALGINKPAEKNKTQELKG
jgi:hypothetical protein